MRREQGGQWLFFLAGLRRSAPMTQPARRMDPFGRRGQRDTASEMDGWIMDEDAQPNGHQEKTMPTLAHSCSLTHVHCCLCTYTYTYTHTRTLTRMHAYIHTHGDTRRTFIPTRRLLLHLQGFRALRENKCGYDTRIRTCIHAYVLYTLPTTVNSTCYVYVHT